MMMHAELARPSTRTAPARAAGVPAFGGSHAVQRLAQTSRALNARPEVVAQRAMADRLSAPVQRAAAGGVVQRAATLTEYMGDALTYFATLEMYSHRGYPKFGGVSSDDAQKARQTLFNSYWELPPEEKTALGDDAAAYEALTKAAATYDSGHLPDFDPELVLYLARNTHVAPIQSVSHFKGTREYHQDWLAPEIGDENANRNYATLYFEITIHDKSTPRRKAWLKGQYAGRSGRISRAAQVEAPTDSGSQIHEVPPSKNADELYFPAFTDNHERSLDSEVAPLDDLLAVIGEEIRTTGIVHPLLEGNVTLFTDRAPCHSCTALIMNFQYETGLGVDVKHGQVDDSKGYGGK
jgi:hypothetical protein